MDAHDPDRGGSSGAEDDDGEQTSVDDLLERISLAGSEAGTRGNDDESVVRTVFEDMIDRIESGPDEDTEARPEGRSVADNPIDRLRDRRAAQPEASRAASSPHRSRPREFYALWALAMLTFGVGDLVTTGVGVRYVPGIVERNPVVAVILETVGMPGFVLFKGGLFIVLIAISLHGSETDDRLAYYVPPVAAILLGVGLTAWNLLNLVTISLAAG